MKDRFEKPTGGNYIIDCYIRLHEDDTPFDCGEIQLKGYAIIPKDDFFSLEAERDIFKANCKEAVRIIDKEIPPGYGYDDELDEIKRLLTTEGKNKK